MMKILITYFSNTGNTEKVAKSMKEGLSDYNVDLFPVKEVDPKTLSSYNIVFIGSGIYASRIDKSVLNLMKKAGSHLPTKLVYFCTHASLNMYQDAFNKVNKLIQEDNCEVIGEFDCVGENLGIPEETQLAMLDKLPYDQKEKAIKIREENRGRPNEIDLKNAKNFALSLVKNF